MQILIIRHGRTQGNIERRYVGARTEEHLLESEKTDLAVCMNEASDVNTDEWRMAADNKAKVHALIALSPMKRAIETADIMFPWAKLPWKKQINRVDAECGGRSGSVAFSGQPVNQGIHIIEELRETDFGIFEGKTYEELNADPDTRDAYQAWIDSGGTMKIPGGESLEESQARSLEGFHKAVQKAKTDGADQLIIVAHGGTVMSVMQCLFGGNYYDYYTGNGDGYTFELEVDDAGDITAAGTYDRFCGRIRA